MYKLDFQATQPLEVITAMEKSEPKQTLISKDFMTVTEKR